MFCRALIPSAELCLLYVVISALLRSITGSIINKSVDFRLNFSFAQTFVFFLNLLRFGVGNVLVLYASHLELPHDVITDFMVLRACDWCCTWTHNFIKNIRLFLMI